MLNFEMVKYVLLHSPGGVTSVSHIVNDVLLLFCNLYLMFMFADIVTIMFCAFVSNY